MLHGLPAGAFHVMNGGQRYKELAIKTLHDRMVIAMKRFRFRHVPIFELFLLVLILGGMLVATVLAIIVWFSKNP